ncbi:MAG: hypothetical protein Q9170_005964 [Blastenia crenularia]
MPDQQISAFTSCSRAAWLVNRTKSLRSRPQRSSKVAISSSGVPKKMLDMSEQSQADIARLSSKQEKEQKKSTQ